MFWLMAGWYPPRGCPALSCFDSAICVFKCLQNPDSKLVTGKIVFLKGLWFISGKSPGVSRGFSLIYIINMAGWGNYSATRNLLIRLRCGALGAWRGVWVGLKRTDNSMSETRA